MAIEEITKLVEESVTSEVFGVWFLIGAALVRRPSGCGIIYSRKEFTYK